MRRYKKSNKVLIAMLILLSIVVGYAIISSNINVVGTAGIKKNTWDIHWDRNSLEVNNKSVSQDLPIISEDNMTITYSVNLKQPGEFYEFTVDAKNYGTIDGMIGIDGLSPVVKNSHDEVIQLPKYLKYTVTYSDNQPIRQYELLKKGQTEKIKVRIEFDKNIDIDDLPDSETGLVIGTEVPYSQPDDNAYEREKAPEKYTITFNPNGGEVTPTSKEVIPEEAVGELPTPTRTNYLFDGWYTGQTDGTQVTEQTIPTGSVTYYAHWTSTIENLEVTPNSISINVGETETLTITGPNQIENYTITSNNPTVATIENNVVTGVSEGTTTITIEGTRSHKTKTINVTITQQKYTITLNPNGGTVSPTSKEINQGSAIGELPTPTRTNYTFDGWHIDVTDYIDIEETYIPNEDITLYAKWYPNNKVAEINGTFYDTLQAAVNDVPTTNTETTIRLLKNTTEKVIVESTETEIRNINLNLRGFTVNNTSSNTIVNAGILKISNGTITCSAGSGAIDVTGTLELNNVTIEATGTRQALYNNGGTVIIRNSDLSSVATQRATLHNLNNGTVTIESGNIISTNLYAVYNEKGTINIGIKDGKTNITKPMIQGKTYGIVANNKYNFYDGIIKGGTYATGTATTGSTPTVAIDTNETKINEIETDSEKVRGEEEIGETTYKTLYLHKTNTITVTFDPNEGEVEPASIQIESGSSVGNLPNPIRRGYIFNGWYTDRTAGERIDNTYAPTEDVTVYARWTEKSTNTVVLNANGGEVTPNEIDVNPNESVGELPIPIREGYKFLGWYTEINGGVPVDSTYVPSLKITTIYARWNNFPVVFKQEGACEFNGSSNITGSECTKYVNKKYIDTGIALYSNENYKKDYEIGFTIESYNPTGNPKQATFVNAKSEDSSVNWPGLAYRRENETDNLEITQTINGTKVSNSISKDDVTTVRIVRIAGVVYYAYNDGELQELQDTDGFNQQFALTTWFGAAPSNATGTSAQRYLNATLSNMYIKLGTYEEEGNYIITFDPNEGQVASTKKKISQGNPIGDLPTPTRDGYTFDGWYTGLTDGIKITEETIPTENTTYYAHWIERIKYTIIFNPNDGEVEELSRDVYQGNLIGDLPTPTRTNYNFEGWYTGLTDGTQVTSTYEPTENKEIFAHWTKIPTYTIHFDTGEGEAVDDQEVVQGHSIGSLPIPTRDTYVFEGWYTDIEYTTAVTVETIPTSDTTYYAKWREKKAIFGNLNIKLKNLAGNSSASSTSENKNILSIQRSSIEPSDENKTAENKISNYNSEEEIYAWFDENTGTIYWWSKSNNLYLSTASSLFNNFSALVSVDIFDSINTTGIKDFSSMFRYCKSLLYLDLSSFDTSNATTFANMFYGCNSLREINLNNWDTGEATNMENMFYGCSSLTSLDIDHFDTKNVTSMSNMFQGCSSLTTIDIRNFDTDKLKYISGMFSGCSSLVSLDVSNINLSKVNSISNMFTDCSNLTSLDLSSWDTTNITSMFQLFLRCSSITTLDLSSFDTSNVEETGMMAMFSSMTNLTELNLGENFDTSKTTYMNAMFYGCSSLTVLDLGKKFDTSSVVDMSTMFMNCGNLTTIYAPNSFVTSQVTSSSKMFKDDQNIVGGNGTKYKSGDTSKTYAKIDKIDNPGYFTLKDGWILVNRGTIGTPSEHLLEQQWSYYNNFERIESGFHLLNDLYGVEEKYFFSNGIAQLGWLHHNGYYYYLSTEDDDNNGYVNANAYRNVIKNIDGTNYTFDSEGRCTNYNGPTFNSVLLNANGGTVKTQIINVPTNTAIGELPTPVRIGYTFKGWCVDLTTGIEVDDTYVPPTDITLYAKWEENSKYKIIFNPNGGQVTPPTRMIVAGYSLGALPTPTNDDLIFDGWYTDLTAGIKIDINTIPTGSVTYYAHWILPCRAFREDSWDTIIDNIKANPHAYEYACQKEVPLDYNNDGETDEYTYVRLVNTTTPTECSDPEYSQSSCGIVIEFNRTVGKASMNPDPEDNTTILNGYGNVGGWKYSSIRQYLNNDIYNALPQDLKNVIIDTKIKAGNGCLDSDLLATPPTCRLYDNGGQPYITVDKLYLASAREIFGKKEGEIYWYEVYDTADEYTRQFDYYKEKNQKHGQGYIYVTTDKWWLRSPNNLNSVSFNYVDNNGQYGSYIASDPSSRKYGVVPYVRIGK